MFKLSEKSRKILRKIYCGLGITTVSLVTACDGTIFGYGLGGAYGMPVAYGMPPINWEDEDVALFGEVLSRETERPIPGIKVSVEGVEFFDHTDSVGNFRIIAPRKDSYTLKFEDLDGQENYGLFKEETITFDLSDVYYKYLTVYLELEDESNSEEDNSNSGEDAL